MYNNEGRLEVQNNGTWGTVCAETFDISEARVICSMLGFDNPFPEICNTSCFGKGNLKPVISDLNCIGNEIDISQCSFRRGDRVCGNILGLFCRTQIRLLDGSNPSEGRLEVKHNNEWGTVCGTNFDASDSRVVCRMFGYDTENPSIYIGNHFQLNGSKKIWMDNLGCWGTEDDLGQCNFSPWGLNNCTHQQDVGIACGISVRLIGGASYNEGRVEIHHANEWGTICETNFSKNEGMVVCRMLGLDTENVTVVSSSTHGNGNQSIKIEDLKCTGSESHVAACKFRGWGHVRCTSGGAVGVICGGTKMRLAGSIRPSEGRLEIFHNNAWGTVCSDNFDTLDAATVCKIMGYETRYPYAIGQAFFGEGTGLVWLDEINCNGTEDDIYKCGSNGWGRTDCGHSKDVSILCDTMVRLAGGSKPANGRIEILHNGLWGTICDANFDQSTATVICTMLGYNNSDAVMYPHAQYGPGTGKIFFTNLHCTGTELDLENCKYSTWDNSQCTHNNDMSIDCATPVRLLGGRGPFEGTVELYHSGKWGEVCDNNFDVRDAEVICKMLGYTVGVPRLLNSTGSGTGLVWMDNLRCDGDETDVALCKSDGFGSKTCSNNRKAAIYCGQDIQVRIHGGKGSYEGNVDIFEGNKWYPVCQEGFSMSAAKVVCRTLGFPDSNDPELLNSVNGYFVESLTDFGQTLSCSGSEGDIGLCHLKEITSNCSQQIIRCPRIAVRLVDGKQPNEGIVEIYHNGQWGTICSGGFHTYDASVICRMLGLQTEEQVFLNDEFGTSNSPVILQNPSCTGNENDISGCLLSWNVHNCSNQSAVGVRCGPTPIRLAGGGGPWEGRVEIFHNGQWGTVCDTGFGNEAAGVVCRMLGFLDDTTDAFVHHGSFYGKTRLPIILDQISCTGTELDINGCRTKDWGYHTCDSNHEAGVLCRATNVRLSGGSHTMEGRVEIKIDGTWSSLCDEEWNDNEATIICKMLTAYPLNRLVQGKAFRNSYFGEGSGTAMLSNLKCNGTEVDLLHCSMKKGGRPNCDHSHDAGVSCSLNSTSHIDGNNKYKGTIHTHVGTYDGSICGRNVNDITGTVLCNSLGYWMNTAVLYKNAWFGQGNGVSFDLQTECSGKESKIYFCPLRNTFGKQNCSHAEDVGVQCAATPLGLNKVRLALGPSNSNGRLEIKYNAKWGAVCSERWTSQNSKAVCRMLGYQNRTIVTNSIHRNDTPVALGSLDCLGVENDIGFCKGDPDKSNCSDEIVNIDCSVGVEIRLFGGSSPADGRVDIKENGQWGSLCDNNYGLAELQVICNTLGYRDTLPYLYHLPSLEMHRVPFGVNQMTCSGMEDHIAQCQMSTTASCHHRYAHLKCFGENNYGTTGLIYFI
ncbi:scavenger receptor cysteine-rich domain superfamily protein-like [Mytilus galloprovincialis]|uniref:scavenger receptor cysteine-rich domain superfamily protein-like n=1 Tax=Mytilus galloprovincialis TaxID=29158 RepID=UPI003F7C74FB